MHPVSQQQEPLPLVMPIHFKENARHMHIQIPEYTNLREEVEVEGLLVAPGQVSLGTLLLCSLPCIV